MRQEAVPEGVAAHVGVAVRGLAGAEEAEAHDAPFAGEAVLAVVEDAGAVGGLGEVGEAVAADLELGGVPAGVGVGGTADEAELRLVGGGVGAEVQGELDLQEFLVFVPGDVGGEVEEGAEAGGGV